VQKIRPAGAADLPVLLPMMRSLAEQPPSLPFDEGQVRAALQEFFAHAEFGQAWLICAGEKIAGYVILTLGYSFEYRGRDAFIDELYVEPEFRRMGLARRAMEFVEQQARQMGVNALHLEVDPQNEPALALYRGAAYQNHDRHLMTKWLQPR
jgi:ribosomal protein S18 acetylase RimI-like enzyme